MEKEIAEDKLQKEKQALWDLVRPDDKDWEFNFVTEMSDYDKIFRKITSVPNWKEDKELVYLFSLMLERKHAYSLPKLRYFRQFFFEQDLVIVPSLYSMNQPLPNTDGLSQEQRKLLLLVNSFVGSRYSTFLNAAYDEVFRQFHAVPNWENNPFLVELYEQVKAHKEVTVDQLMPINPQTESEAIRVRLEQQVSRNKKQVESQISRNQPLNESHLKDTIRKIRCRNWYRNETLRQWNRILVSQLCVFRMKQQGTWQSRIAHEEQKVPKGVLSRIWAKVTESKTSN